MRARCSRNVGLALALLGLAACRPKVGGAIEVADDIDAIEQALAERQSELATQGVVVAYRDVNATTTPTGPQMPATPEVGDAGGDDAITPEATPVTPSSPVDITEPDAADEAPTMGKASAPYAERESVSVGARHRRGNRVERRAEASKEASRCERVCALAESTCDLRARICTLAGRHPGDIRYAVACRRAEDQCDAARGPCESCAA